MPDMKDNALGNSPETKEADQPTFRVRKLTPKECWKLMGFEPSDYERARDAMNENIYNGRDRSGSQLYKQAGNSIVVDVLLHIMENLYEAMPYLFEDIQVGSFFSGIGAFEKALTRLNPDVSAETGDGVDLELTQIGYINHYNGDANRIYDGSAVARVLKAEAGGGGAKTGWYRVDPPPTALQGVIIDDTMGFEAEPRMYEEVCPSLRASRQGLKTITGIIDPQGRKEKIPKLQENCPTLRAQIHGNPPCAVYEVRNDEGNSAD